MKSFVSLMYHNVTDREAEFDHLSPSITSYFVDLSTFADQLRSINERAACIRFDDVERFFEQSIDHARDAKPAVQITFDDGWQGTLDAAGPLLESYGFQAMVFVTTGLVDKPLFLSRRNLANMSRDQFQFGSHGVTHRMLNQLSESEIEAELRDSKLALEDILGYEVSAVSIPGGAADERVLRLAGEAGYRYVFTSHVHVNTRQSGPWNIGRVPVRQTTNGATFKRFLGQRLQREKLRRLLLECPKRLLGKQGYASLRRLLLGESSSHREMTDLLVPRGQKMSEVSVAASFDGAPAWFEEIIEP